MSLDIAFLRSRKLIVDIEKAIKAYLRYRTRVEPWMYWDLALAIEINKGSASEVKTALGWAGYLARKAEDTDSMIRVGDLLLFRKIFEVPLARGNEKLVISPGELFDEANRRAPHRPEPILLSIQLAVATKDPKRMGAAVEKLLAVPWPGFDEAWRTEALRVTKDLAKTLREENRDAEADALLARLPDASARDLFIRLSWIGDAGLELVVQESMGATATYLHPRTPFGGAIVKNMYGTKNAECIYSCPRGFDGDYIIKIDVIYNDAKKPVNQAVLEIITHEGTPEEHVERKTVSLAKLAPITVTLQGGRRKEVLPFQANPIKPDQKLVAPGRAPAASPTRAPASAPTQPASNRSAAPIR